LKRLTNSFTVPNYFFTFLGLSVFFVIFSFFAPLWLQNGVAALGILSFGILHGANDLKIIAKKTQQQSTSSSLKFFVLYIGVVLLGIVLFFLIPKIGLLSFVLVSCYHFGEQHWSSRALNQKALFLRFFLYGALIFFTLFTFQYDPSAEVIFQMTGVRLPFYFFWMGLLVSFLGFVLSMLRAKIKWTDFSLELFLLVILAVLFSKASLMFGFGLYFVLWHSIPSLNSQLEYIYEESTKKSWMSYLKSASVYWVLAILGLVLFFKFVQVSEQQYLSIFFSFLAAITFPHAVVMGLMFHSKESNEE